MICAFYKDPGKVYTPFIGGDKEKWMFLTRVSKPILSSRYS